jgi:hypothetical protein
MTSAFSQTGGARLGWFNVSWPFASLLATKDSLCLSCLGRDYTFSKSAIRSLSRHRGIFSTGLRIEHVEPSFPEFVVFWTFCFQKLKTQLESLGYPVRDC